MTVLEMHTPDPRTFDEQSRPFAEAVASRYAIRKLIGRGGMGMVYLARDRRLDRLVAIKTLPPQLATDESLRQRFLRETRTAGAMSHPNIVPIHGADEIDGHVFFVMGFVDGDSLAAHVRSEGRLDPREAARILRDVASALAHAHERGIIHRDVKAENILLDRASGRALVTDFGIARLAEAAPLTATGQMLGTVYYISPEQVAGDRVDARSDLYSLGVVGFLMLTGRFPFDAELASAVLIAHVNRPAPAVRSVTPEVPSSLASIVDRCLAKDPAHRYESASTLLAALDGAIAEMDRGSKSTVAVPPRLISDTEANAVWQRAAELQASTGVHPRPQPVPQPRDAAKDQSRTGGVRLDHVVDAGREAGISTRYLDHAMVERGLVASKTSRVAEPKRGRASWWAGAPLDIVEQVEVPGEIDARHFDRLFSILREGTSRIGEVTASKREFGWRAGWTGHRLEASVIPADGVTVVRLAQSVRRMAATTTAASILVLGGVVGPMASTLSWWIMRHPTPRFMRALDLDMYLSRNAAADYSLLVGLAATLLTVPIGRALVRSLYRLNAARLRTLSEAIAANVRLAVRDDEER